MSLEKELDKLDAKMEKIGDKLNERAESLPAKIKADPKKYAAIVAGVVVVLVILGIVFGA